MIAATLSLGEQIVCMWLLVAGAVVVAAAIRRCELHQAKVAHLTAVNARLANRVLELEQAGQVRAEPVPAPDPQLVDWAQWADDPIFAGVDLETDR